MYTPTRTPLRIYELFWSGFDWLFPPVCAGCGKAGERWCAACQDMVQVCLPPMCPLCGNSQRHDYICSNCRQSPPQYTELRSWAYFEGPLRKAIHQLKYERNITLGDVLAKPMAVLVSQSNWSFDFVVSVPLSARRLKERGYNQADFLARPVAMAFGKPLKSKCLWRVRETHSQVGLNALERVKNVDGAFAAAASLAGSCDILLVDDVMTTGATLNACAAALKSAGARNVYGLTLARAVLN